MDCGRGNGLADVDFTRLKFPEQVEISTIAKDFITALLSVDPV